MEDIYSSVNSISDIIQEKTKKCCFELLFDRHVGGTHSSLLIILLFLLLKYFSFSYDFLQFIYLYDLPSVWKCSLCFAKFEYSFHKRLDRFIPQYLQGEERLMSVLGY